MTHGHSDIPVSAEEKKGERPSFGYPGDAEYSAQLLKLATNRNFTDLESLLIIHLDHLEGIKSSIEYDPKKYKPSGVALYRDATKAKPLADRDLNHPVILAENMLLRGLNTLRAVDHVLAKKEEAAETSFILQEIKASRQALLAAFIETTNAVRAMQAEPPSEDAEPPSIKDIEKLEKNLNTAIFTALHENDLTVGINKENAAELLTHYRNLASLLDPAKAMVTVLSHEVKKTDGKTANIIHTETAYPITKKTDQQKKQLDIMSVTSTLRDSVEERKGEAKGDSKEAELKEIKKAKKDPKRNFHNVKVLAFQQANNAFVDLMKLDDRRLPAQTRKTIAPTAKNAYVVHNRLDFKTQGEEQKQTSETWSLRMGSPVYVGKGENDEVLTQYTHEVKEQLHQATKEFVGERKLHFTALVTDSGREHQDTVLRITRGIMTGNLSEVPTNVEAKIRGTLKTNVVLASSIGNMVQKDEHRHLQAAKVGLGLANSQDTINVFFCNSGQDRTGTVQELFTDAWIQQEYYRQLSLNIDLNAINDFHVRGGANVVLATLAAPGSAGLKNDSNPNSKIGRRVFSESVEKALYNRSTAKTNKSAAIDEEQIKNILKSTGARQLPEDKSRKEEKITDAHIEEFKDEINKLSNDYDAAKKKKFMSRKKSQLSDLKKDIDVKLEGEFKEKTLNEKLVFLVSRIKNIWQEGLIKYKMKSYDDLIDLVNDEPNEHSTYRNLGYLLQQYKIRFPESLSGITFSETKKIIIPAKLVIKEVNPGDYSKLKSQIESCISIASVTKEQLKTLNTIFNILKANDSDEKRDAAYCDSLMMLNDIWKSMCKKQKGSLSQQNASMLAELNRNQEPNFARAIATILQDANRKYSHQLGHPILIPPIDGLKHRFGFIVPEKAPERRLTTIEIGQALSFGSPGFSEGKRPDFDDTKESGRNKDAAAPAALPIKHLETPPPEAGPTTIKRRASS